MPKYYERDRDMVRPPTKTKPYTRPVYDDDEDGGDEAPFGYGIAEDRVPPLGVGNDEEGAAISVDLFNLAEADRVAVLRARKEAEIAETIINFDTLLEGPLDGTILYWERIFGRKDGEKMYRYAALFSDGLWWITGRHTSGRTQQAMITELILHGQRADTVIYMGANQIDEVFDSKPHQDINKPHALKPEDPETQALLGEEEEIEARIRIVNQDDEARATRTGPIAVDWRSDEQ